MAVVVPFIGAAIGSFAVPGTILGLSGGAFGWLAGSLLSSLIFKPPAQQGPRLQDLTITGTDYGQTIPWVAGSPRLAPTYVWVSQLREIANTQKVGKGGGQKVTSYTYECDVMLRLTENITEGAARDWINSELVRNELTIKDGLWSGISIYTGEIDQLPDPTYEAAVGAGNAPAYRGGTTIVITGLQLGNGKQLPNFEHQIGTPQFGRSDFLFYAPYDTTLNDISENALPASLTTSGTLSYVLGEGKFQSGLYYTGTKSPTLPAYISYSSSIFSIPVGAFTIGFWVRINATPGGNFLIWFRRNDSNLTGSMSVQAQASVLRLTGDTTGNIDGSFTIGVWHHVAISRSAAGVLKFFIDGDLIGSLNEPAILGNCNLLVVHGNTTNDSMVDANIDDLFVIAGEDLYPTAFDAPTSAIGAEERNPYLHEVIGQLMARAGYAASEFGVSQELGQVVNGYATSSVTSTRAHLETLRPFGLYECNCSDKIYIFPRATTPAGSIPWEDLGASESPGEPADPFPLQVGNEIEVPAQIAVRYRNVAANWNIGTEFSDRLRSSREDSPQVVEMGFGMTPAQAKKVAETMLKDAMAGLGRATIRVGGRKHAKYEPGDVLTTTAPNGTAYRFRIITKRDYIFMLEWEVALDDASALDSPAITYEGYIETTEPLRVAPTSWEVLNIPAVQDSDAAAPGPYVAVTPARDSETDEWPGAVFVRARLPEAYEQEFISGDACVIGECQTTLGDFDKGSTVLQREGRLRVRVRGELSSSTWDDFYVSRTINAAVVGDEPIRFLTATFVSTDGQFRIYDLSGFMRGQLGQEHLIGTHGSGERFVLLNNSIRRMVNETTDIDAEHQVKAVTLNLLLDSVVEENFTDSGIALKPYSPWNLRALSDGSDIEVTWRRRSRLVGRYTDTGTFTPLGENTEAYRVKVYDNPAADPVRTVDVTTGAWTYAAADIATDGFTSSDLITITVQQLSETVGEGFAATVEVTAP